MIPRSPAAAAGAPYDLIIVGAGIHGSTLALLAASQGLRPLLLDRGDFGEGTSWNSLRIVHGGFRYLQTGDLYRFAESVAERRWFLRHFPELVRPLPCLLPLYGSGLKRAGILRAGLALNDLLSRGRNRGVAQELWLPDGRVLDAAETASVFPRVKRNGLRAGAVWYDAAMSSSSRVLIEVIKWAGSLGATALNYVEVTGYHPVPSRGEVTATDRVSGETLTFRAPVVVNCAGPWCRALAAQWDRDRSELFRPSLGFNLVLNRAPLSAMAVAVSPPSSGARTYFIYGSQDLLFAGTYHHAWSGPIGIPVASPGAISALLQDLNDAIPGMGLQPDEVVRVLPGFIPVRREGSLDFSNREVIVDHQREGGPEGLISVSGVKFTTARRVAEKACRLIVGKLGRRWRTGLPDRVRSTPPPSTAEFRQLIGREPRRARDLIAALIGAEAVMQADDLLLRRTEWGIDPGKAAEIRAMVAAVLRDRPQGAGALRS